MKAFVAPEEAACKSDKLPPVTEKKDECVEEKK